MSNRIVQVTLKVHFLKINFSITDRLKLLYKYKKMFLEKSLEEWLYMIWKQKWA